MKVITFQLDNGDIRNATFESYSETLHVLASGVGIDLDGRHVTDSSGRTLNPSDALTASDVLFVGAAKRAA